MKMRRDQVCSVMVAVVTRKHHASPDVSDANHHHRCGGLFFPTVSIIQRKKVEAPKWTKVLREDERGKRSVPELEKSPPQSMCTQQVTMAGVSEYL